MATQFRAGDAIISTHDCFPSLAELQEEFDPFGLIDFCTGIDAAVLHERLYTSGLPDPDANPILKSLLRDGVVVDLVNTGLFRVTPEVMLGHPATRYPLMILTLIQKDMVKLSYPKVLHDPAVADRVLKWAMSSLLNTTKELVVEDGKQIAVVPSWSGSIVWRHHPLVREEDAAFTGLTRSLAERYSDLREPLLALRSSVEGDNQFRMPPIALQVLTRADRTQDLGDVFLDIRHQYRKVRAYFASVEAILDDPHLPLAKKLKEKAGVERAVVELLGKSHEDSAFTRMTSFARTLNDSVAAEKLLDGVKAGDVSLGKLTGRLIGLAETAYWRFKLRPLHATKKAYLALSSAAIGNAVKTHFHHDVTRSDNEQIKGFEDLIKSAFALVKKLDTREGEEADHDR
jgi:hypothetical protein